MKRLNIEDRTLKSNLYETGKEYKITKMIKDAFVHDESTTRKDDKVKTNIETMYIFFFDKKTENFF